MKEILSFWIFYFVRYSERRQHLGNWTRLLPEVMGDIYAVEPELISVTGEQKGKGSIVRAIWKWEAEAICASTAERGATCSSYSCLGVRRGTGRQHEVSHDFPELLQADSGTLPEDRSRPLHWISWWSSNALDLYSRDARFESPSGHRLSSLTIFVLFLGPSREVPG